MPEPDANDHDPMSLGGKHVIRSVWKKPEILIALCKQSVYYTSRLFSKVGYYTVRVSIVAPELGSVLRGLYAVKFCTTGAQYNFFFQ